MVDKCALCAWSFEREAEKHPCSLSQAVACHHVCHKDCLQTYRLKHSCPENECPFCAREDALQEELDHKAQDKNAVPWLKREAAEPLASCTRPHKKVAPAGSPGRVSGLELQVTKLELLAALAATCQGVVVQFDNVNDMVQSNPGLLGVLGTSREEIHAVLETLRRFSEQAHEAQKDVSTTLKDALKTPMDQPAIPAKAPPRVPVRRRRGEDARDQSSSPAKAPPAVHYMRTTIGQSSIPAKAPPPVRNMHYRGDDGSAPPPYTEGAINSWSDLQEAWRAVEASAGEQ